MDVLAKCREDILSHREATAKAEKDAFPNDSSLFSRKRRARHEPHVEEVSDNRRSTSFDHAHSDQDQSQGIELAFTEVRVDALPEIFPHIICKLQQKCLKQVIKLWLERCHTYKQQKHAYGGGNAKTPDYWPSDICRHKEPDHIRKEGKSIPFQSELIADVVQERIPLAVHLLCAGDKYQHAKFDISTLQESTESITKWKPKDCNANTMPLLNALYAARKEHIRFEDGEIGLSAPPLCRNPVNSFPLDGEALVSIQVPVSIRAERRLPRIKRQRRTGRKTIGSAPLVQESSSLESSRSLLDTVKVESQEDSSTIHKPRFLLDPSSSSSRQTNLVMERRVPKLNQPRRPQIPNTSGDVQGGSGENSGTMTSKSASEVTYLTHNGMIPREDYLQRTQTALQCTSPDTMAKQNTFSLANAHTQSEMTAITPQVSTERSLFQSQPAYSENLAESCTGHSGMHSSYSAASASPYRPNSFPFDRYIGYPLNHGGRRSLVSVPQLPSESITSFGDASKGFMPLPQANITDCPINQGIYSNPERQVEGLNAQFPLAARFDRVMPATTHTRKTPHTFTQAGHILSTAGLSDPLAATYDGLTTHSSAPLADQRRPENACAIRSNESDVEGRIIGWASTEKDSASPFQTCR